MGKSNMSHKRIKQDSRKRKALRSIMRLYFFCFHLTSEVNPHCKMSERAFVRFSSDKGSFISSYVKQLLHWTFCLSSSALHARSKDSSGWRVDGG